MSNSYPRDTGSPIDVACFGAITPATLLVVDELPEWNTGGDLKCVTEFVSEDAAIISILLSDWGLNAAMIGTALGDDDRGRKAAAQLKKAGVFGEPRFDPTLTTPYEVNISDRKGGRTYLWKRDPSVLATLESADLSPIAASRVLYADWYDGEHILRAMREAERCAVPVFLNFEHGHRDAELLKRYAPHVDICQATTDTAQKGDDLIDVALNLLDSGITTALVTAAGGGCLGMTREESIRVYAPDVEVVDTCGAGATFSAGFIYGLVRDWDMETRLRFAVASASLKCTVVGPTAFPIDRVQKLAASLNAEHRSDYAHRR